MKRLLGLLCALLFSVPAFADQCNMLPSMDTWSNGGTSSWRPTLYTTQKTFSFPITISYSGSEGFTNVPVKLVKVKPNTKYTVYTDVSVSGTDKSGFEVAGYETEADATVSSAGTTNNKKTFYLGDSVQPKTTTFTTTATTEYVVVSITNWSSSTDLTITAENKVIMVEGDSITNTNIPQCGAMTLNSLPSGYQQLEYLESSGTQYIDTGVVPTQNSKMILDAQLTSETTAGLAGARQTYNSQAFYVIGFGDASKFSGGFGNVQANTIVSDLNRHTLELSQNGFYIDNVLRYTYQTQDAFVTPGNLTIGSINENGTKKYQASAKFYSAEFYNNDNIVAKFVPARRVSDGVLGMYDLADSDPATAFHTNAGTGTFIAGPTIIPSTFERLQYIESTGTQAIDTGIAGNSAGNKYKIGFMRTVAGTGPSGHGIIGTHNVNTPYDRSYIATFGSSWEWGYSSSYREEGVQNNVYYDIELDTTNTKYKVVVNNETLKDVTYEGNRSTAHILIGTVYRMKTPYMEQGKFYYAKIYDSDGTTLLMNLVPVKRLSDGEVGMFDTVTGAFLTNSGTGDFVAGPSAVMKIATTKYNTNAFSGVVTALNNAVDTIKTVVANTINQATAVANLQSGKQTMPDSTATNGTCPNYRQCLLVEDESGVPHWYVITDPFRDYVAPIIANGTNPNSYVSNTGYTQLEYLQSDGNQWIDTGFYYTSANHKAVVKFSHVEPGSGAYPYWLWGADGGGSGGAGSRTGALALQTGGTKIGVGVGSAAVGTTTYTIDNPSTPITVSVETKSNNTFTVIKDGVAVYTDVSFAGSGVAETPVTEVLFGVHSASSVTRLVATKIYFAQFYDNGSLVRDFVPVRRNSDGKYGMYDKVNNTFYPNAASSGDDFTPGPEVINQDPAIPGMTWTATWNANANSGIAAGTINAVSRCASVGASANYTYDSPSLLSALSAERQAQWATPFDSTTIDTYTMCWCKVNNVVSGNETLVADKTEWMFYLNLSTALGCAQNCARYCAGSFEDRAPFRKTIFGM